MISNSVYEGWGATEKNQAQSGTTSERKLRNKDTEQCVGKTCSLCYCNIFVENKITTWPHGGGVKILYIFRYDDDD